ncbi:MAG: hypothetical protein AB7P22_01735 [Vicinamibacterales bacterium]
MSFFAQASADKPLRFTMRELEVVLAAHPSDQMELLEHLVNHASETFTPKTTLHMVMTRSGERGREVVEGGGALRKVCCDEVALGYMLYRMTSRLLELYGGQTAVHCAAASIDGRLALFTGDRGAGKTTLLLRLMLDGAAFHCDEMVLAHDGVATTLPRRLHVKDGTLAHLPEVAEACEDKPFVKHGKGPRFYPVDPTELGHQWASVSRRPSVIFRLAPAFDRPPELAPVPQIQMVKTLMCQTLSGHLNIGRQAENICSMVRGVPCYELRVGPLLETSEIVRQAVAAIDP